jgi:hypothetical protein
MATQTAIAGTGGDDATVGTITWTSTGNVTADDSAYALYSEAGGNTLDNSIKLIKGGTISGTDKSAGATWSVDVEETVSFGSTSDLWGITLTPTDVNASNFGVGISAKDTTTVSHYLTGTNYGFTTSGTINGITATFNRLTHNGAGSFVAGTMVETMSGRIPIELIGEDDKVIGFKDFGLGEYEVTHTIVKDVEDTLIIQAGGVSVHTTPNHPFLTKKGFLMADKLKKGDGIFRLEGGSLIEVTITSIKNMGASRVYNFTVDDVHTYIANGFAVHNTALPLVYAQVDYIQISVDFTPPASGGHTLLMMGVG